MIRTIILVLCVGASSTLAKPGFGIQLDPLEDLTPTPTPAPTIERGCAIGPAPKPDPILVTKSDPTTMTALEARIIKQALQCNRGNPKLRLPVKDLLAFLRMEEDFGVPRSMRGLVLAAACSESGMQARAVGDGGKAVGILQMWPWWEKAYNIDRENPYQAVRAWLRHTQIQADIAKRKCRVGTTAAWRIGEARSSRGAIGKGYVRQLRKLPLPDQNRILLQYGVPVWSPQLTRKLAVRIGRRELPRKAIRYAERCYDLTGHVKRLRKWKRRSRQQRERSAR